MRIVSSLAIAALLSALFAAAPNSAQQGPSQQGAAQQGTAQQGAAQQGPELFRWMDFHNAKDQDIVIWVTRSLSAEKWTALREIGVFYDAALVVTSLRSAPDSSPDQDAFTVWSVSLTNHGITPLLKGYNLRWLDFMTFTEGALEEPTILYDNCSECSPDTYFTSLHFDKAEHTWEARWMRAGQGVHVWTGNPPAAVSWTQVYAGLAEPNGRDLIGTWNHFDYGKQKPAEDFVYRYDLAPISGLERTQLLSGKEAEAMKQRVCRNGEALPGLARGQDSELCQQLVNPGPARKPVTTPPANNRGRSTPGTNH